MEVASYQRIQAVRRPASCEGFVLFPRMAASDRVKRTVTLERFGAPLECRNGGTNMSCCGRMCDALPLHGDFGLCQQLSCIAAVLHLANVTHLDMEPKNILFDDTRPVTEGGPPQGQVALFDFDIAVSLAAERALPSSQRRCFLFTFVYVQRSFVCHPCLSDSLFLSQGAGGDCFARSFD